MVSDMPGTTRDAIDATQTWHRRQFRIVDTAGMRRPGRVRSGGKVELVSVAGAKKAIFDADVVALLIDSKDGATDQDAAIGGEADRAGRGVVVVASTSDSRARRSVSRSGVVPARSQAAGRRARRAAPSEADAILRPAVRVNGRDVAGNRNPESRAVQGGRSVRARQGAALRPSFLG